MRFLVAVLLCLSLAGCGVMQYFNLKPTWPRPASEESLKPCEDLKKFENKNADGSVDLLEFQKSVIENYLLHYKCSDKNDSWIDWYITQKRVYESGGKK